MSKRKCSIPKGHKLLTNPAFCLPFNYILIDTRKGEYTWCNHDLSERITLNMWPLSYLDDLLLNGSRQVIR